jgi:hypothetical protein
VLSDGEAEQLEKENWVIAKIGNLVIENREHSKPVCFNFGNYGPRSRTAEVRNLSPFDTRTKEKERLVGRSLFIAAELLRAKIDWF